MIIRNMIGPLLVASKRDCGTTHDIIAKSLTRQIGKYDGPIPFGTMTTKHPVDSGLARN